MIVVLTNCYFTCNKIAKILVKLIDLHSTIGLY